MASDTISKLLRERFTSQETACGDGTSEESIREFEVANGVVVPDDLRSYLIEIDGTSGDYAYGIIRFWCLAEICSISEELQSKRHAKGLIHSCYDRPFEEERNYFVFADHMHEAQLYAIQLTLTNNHNSIVMLDGSAPVKVADSFTEFVMRYLSAPESLKLTVD